MSRNLLLCILIVSLLVLLPAVSGQQTGLIIEVNPLGEQNTGALNPLLCDNIICRRVTDLLFPYLLEESPARGGVVVNADVAGDTITYYFDQNRQWSDGEPVTAYDAFYSYLYLVHGDVNTTLSRRVTALIRAVVPLDAHTLVITYQSAGCERVNFPVIPVHAFDPDFIAAVGAQGENLARWLEDDSYDSFRSMASHPLNTEPTVSSGPFQFYSREFNHSIRLMSADGSTAFEYLDIEGSGVNAFMRGEVNLLVNPRFNRWQDIRAAEHVQITELPGNQVFYIGLNLATINNPQSAFGDEGEPLEQGHHPIFSDLRVRQAMQMAIDVDALIDAVAEGNGIPVAANLPPAAAAYTGLEPVAYDPFAAAQLLEAAGWKDTNGDGRRECITCETAQYGDLLIFELQYPDDDNFTGSPMNYPSMANIIAQQLRQVGFEVNSYPYVPEQDGIGWSMHTQAFDAYISVLPLPTESDLLRQFTPAGDVLFAGSNFTSYNNPRVTELVETLQTTCAADDQHELYAELQRELQADQPYIWLFSPNRMIAAQGDAAQYSLLELVTP